MTLYEINELIAGFLASHINEETGEIEGIEELDALSLARDEKLDSLASYYKDLVAEAKAVKEEKQNLDSRQKRLERRAERLKDYISYSLNGEAFRSPRNEMRFRKTEILDISEGAEIPEQFLRYKTPEVDKVSLKKAIKEGYELDGVHIIDRLSLSIK